MIGKTWNDLVGDYFPDADVQRRHDILWELTAFPFAPLTYVMWQLEMVVLEYAGFHL